MVCAEATVRPHGDSVSPDFEMGNTSARIWFLREEDHCFDLRSGKCRVYNFYRMAGMAVDGKDKGRSRERSQAYRRQSLLP